MVEENLLHFLIVWVGLLIIAWSGDNLVEKFVLELQPKSFLRATDTVLHGLIGGFSFWLTCHLCPEVALDASLFSYLGQCCNKKIKRSCFTSKPLQSMCNFCVAFMMSCIVDLDHVIKDIIRMINNEPHAFWERGFLHLSLHPLILSLILHISAVIFHCKWCLKFGTLIVVCIFSHHVRDGVHHGLWFHPFGKTEKLPQWLYISITQSLPILTGAVAYIILYQIKSNLPVTNEIHVL